MATRSDNPSQDDLTLPALPSADGGGVADPGPSGGGLNVMTAVSRRWPLVVVGLIGGVVFGFLFHLQRAPVYQSGAQVLVIKNRTEMVSTGPDARMQYIEDIVSTQVVLLKSERLLLAAARRVNPDEVRVPLPEDPKALAGMINAGLTVSREREPGSGGAPAVANGVLALSFKSATPEASRAFLNAVIKAYQEELGSLYNQATTNQITYKTRLVEHATKEKLKAIADRGRLQDEMRKSTKEDVANIRTRLSAQRERQISLELEQSQLDKQLALIAAAGQDPRKRRDALFMLTATGGSGRTGEVSANSVEAAYQQQQITVEELAEQYGPDHPLRRSAEKKVVMLRNLLFKGIEPSPGEIADELWTVQMRLAQRKSTVDDQVRQLAGIIRLDNDVLQEAGQLADGITMLSERIAIFEREIDKRNQELTELRTTAEAGGYQAQVLTEPAPGGKVAPVLYQSLMIGLVLGMLVGVGLAVLAEMTDQGFRSPAEVRRRLGLPVIGHLPRLNPDNARADSPHPDLDPNLVLVHKPKSVEAEAYRGLRTQLYFNTAGRGHQVIQVTSPNPGDGKSTLAANLAASIAQSGKRVVLVDCDFRKPRVHKVWNLPNPDIGMSAVVAGDAELKDAIQKSALANLDLMPCGPRPANPAELLTHPAFADILADLRAAYDFVILDTPPMLAVSDPSVVAPRVDGVVLVLRMSKKARPAAERARELLAAVGGNVIGVAVNGVGGRNSSEYGYGYGNYGYGYAYNYKYQYQYEYEYADTYADSADDAEEIDNPAPPLKG